MNLIHSDFSFHMRRNADFPQVSPGWLTHSHVTNLALPPHRPPPHYPSHLHAPVLEAKQLKEIILEFSDIFLYFFILALSHP